MHENLNLNKYLNQIWETGELLPDRSTEPYSLKQKAEIGTLGSRSQLFRYIHILITPFLGEHQSINQHSAEKSKRDLNC